MVTPNIKHHLTFLKPFLFFLTILFLTSLACGPDQNLWKYQGPESDVLTQPLKGEVIGKADNIWMVNGQEITCTDPNTSYQLTIFTDKQPPKDTHITSSFPAGMYYFRLEAYPVLQLVDVDKGGCLNRDPSQDRVHMIIEGGYNNSQSFTVLSCSHGDLTKGNIFATDVNTFNGMIDCSLGSQNKVHFDFSNLEVK
jgi:hypothetical protein